MKLNILLIYSTLCHTDACFSPAPAVLALDVKATRTDVSSHSKDIVTVTVDIHSHSPRSAEKHRPVSSPNSTSKSSELVNNTH